MALYAILTMPHMHPLCIPCAELWAGGRDEAPESGSCARSGGGGALGKGGGVGEEEKSN